jgi:hypothetical protein
VHSLVEYVDGSVLAQLGAPDMRTPIAHALAWPERIESGVEFLDLLKAGRLDFRPPDTEKFRCLALAQAAARAGGLYPVLLNAANEVAVQAFLEGRLNFPGIAAADVVQRGQDARPADWMGCWRRTRKAGARSERILGMTRAASVKALAHGSSLDTVLVHRRRGTAHPVHEFGHYFVARRLGFKVLRFSVGFGKPLLKWVGGADRVEYVVAAIPLGGYVKLLDEREGPVPPEELARSFTHRPPWQRIAVLLAGPAFNILFAVLVLAGMFWVNGIDEMRPRIGDVTVDSIAARSGLRSGDEIQSVDGRAVAGWRDVVLGLLDGVSSRNEIVLGVRDAAGAARTLHLPLPDAEQRRHLTEPAELPAWPWF